LFRRETALQAFVEHPPPSSRSPIPPNDICESVQGITEMKRARSQRINLPLHFYPIDIEKLFPLILFAPLFPPPLASTVPHLIQRRLPDVTPWLTPAFFILAKRKSVTDGLKSAEPDQSQEEVGENLPTASVPPPPRAPRWPAPRAGPTPRGPNRAHR
jgi:hypothetical protein